MCYTANIKISAKFRFSENNISIFALLSGRNLVSAERKCKFQRANVKKKLAFSLLSEAEIQ